MDSDKNTHDGLVEPVADEMTNEESVKELGLEMNQIQKEEELNNVSDLNVNQQLDDGTPKFDEKKEESFEVEVEPVKLENSSIGKIEKVDESPFGNDAVVELVDDIIEKEQVEEKENEGEKSINDEKKSEKEPSFELEEEEIKDIEDDNKNMMNIANEEKEKEEHNEKEKEPSFELEEEEIKDIEDDKILNVGIEENTKLEDNDIENKDQVIKEKKDVEVKPKTNLDDDEDGDDEVIKIYDENDHQRDALDDEVEENSSQDVELEHEIEFIDSSNERGNKSPPSFRSNQMRFRGGKRGLTERSELSCIPELTQESVLRNSTISDDKQDILNSMTMTKSQMSEFKTASAIRSLKEVEGAADRMKTQENQFLTENDEQQQPKGLTESKSSNIETMNLIKNNKDFLAVPKKMPRAKSQEGIKSSEVAKMNQQEGNQDEILHHIDEASHESKSSVEGEPEGSHRNLELAFTFGRQQLLPTELIVLRGSSIENEENLKSLEKPVIKINSEQASKTVDLTKNLSGISVEDQMSETVQDIRSATEVIGGYSAAESNISSIVAFRKNVSKTEQPEQDYESDSVVEKTNNTNMEKRRSAGLSSKYGEDDYANEEFESLTQTASALLHNKLSKDQTRLSAFQSGQSLIHQESQEYYEGMVEQGSQSSQNQYRLPDPESFDEYDEQEVVEGAEGVEAAEIIENKGEQEMIINQENLEEELSIIKKKSESFSASEKGHFEEKSLIEKASKPEILVVEKEETEDEIVPSQEEVKGVEDASPIDVKENDEEKNLIEKASKPEILVAEKEEAEEVKGVEVESPVDEKENDEENNVIEQAAQNEIREQEDEIIPSKEELKDVKGEPSVSEKENYEEENLPEEAALQVIEKEEQENDIAPSQEEIKNIEGESSYPEKVNNEEIKLAEEVQVIEKEEEENEFVPSKEDLKGVEVEPSVSEKENYEEENLPKEAALQVIEKEEQESDIAPSQEEIKNIEGESSHSEKANNEEKNLVEEVSQVEDPVREKEEQESCIILSRVEVKSKSSSKRDSKPVKTDHNAKQSASPESQPSSRGGERVEPIHSKGDELIQKALSDFSEDIPLEIQKGAVPKIKPLQSSQDETLASVIQRGATPNLNNEALDAMYGLEELTARYVEEMQTGILTPRSEVGSEKKSLSQENTTKLTRRVPAPVMKRRSSSKIRANTKSFIIADQGQEDQTPRNESKLLPEMQIRVSQNVSVKREQVSAPKSRPSGSKSPQVRHSVIQKKENGQFIIQNIDVIVPEIQRDDPKKYPIDVSPTRLYSINKPSGRPVKRDFSGRKSKTPSQSPKLLSSSVLVETDKKKRIRPNNKPLLVQKNNSESSVSMNIETEDEKIAAFERDHKRRVNGREKEKQSQAYYLRRGPQDTTRAFHNHHILEPLNHSRADYPSRVSDMENEETSIYSPKGYNPYRQARHSSISHQRVDELEETIQIPRYNNKDYRKAGIPEDVSSQIRKTMAKQKEILKRADMYNPYNPYWTKKMLNDHFGVDIEPSNDSEHNRWKLRRIKQNRHDTQPRDSQQDAVPTSQPEEDKVIFSQNFPPWDSSPRRQEVRRPSPNQKRSGSNPHRRLSPMLVDPQRREQQQPQQQIKINVNVNNYLIQSSELYKGAVAMYSSPKDHQEEAVEEGTFLSSPMARPRYMQGAKRNSVRRHRPMNDINSARGETFHVRNSMDHQNI